MPADDPTSPFAPGPPPSSWPARWIRHPTASRDPAGVYHFRRVFDLPVKPVSFRVRVSADNRFRLFVNGISAAAGPARGDVQHWRYQIIDLAPRLRAGRNVLAAVTWFLDDAVAPLAQMMHGPGFVLCGDEESSGIVNTPEGWKCFRNSAYTFTPIGFQEAAGYYVAGPGE